MKADLKYIFLIDVNLNNIFRDLLKVSIELKKINPNFRFVCIYDDYEKKDFIVESNEKLSKDHILVRSSPNQKFFDNLFSKYRPIFCINMAQRIFDMSFNIEANKRNIPVFSFQHGLYIDFMKRDLIFYIKKIFKSIRYLKYIFFISLNLKNNFFTNYLHLFNSFVFGVKLSKTSLKTQKLNANYVYIYADFWKAYYRRLFGYLKKQFIVVGTPDLCIIDKLSKKTDDSICYICQSLVEDGRLKRKAMMDFLDNLNKLVNGKTLYIKLHQRSDLGLYKNLARNKNVQFTKSFPNSKLFIGHYSSLLSVPIYLKRKIFFFKFENHNQYPGYLTRFGIFSKSYKLLERFINNNHRSESNSKNNIEKYFKYNANPHAEVANSIIEKINSLEIYENK
jgi:hypothetical protein